MLLGGKPAWSVEMLAVLLVLTLVPTLSDGLLLKKCDLKSQLEKALSDLQGKNNEEMIAKLVCTLEHISGFNTSLVTITDQFSNRPFLHGNDEEHSSEISDQDTELPEDYNGQHKKRRNAPSMDGGDGSGEASIDQSAENTEADHGPTDLPPGTTEEPSIYYDTFEMLFGFTTSPPETTTTLPPEEPIYYDDFETIFGFTTPPPDVSEEHADYYDKQVRKRRDTPSMDGGDGSGEASIDQSAENTEADHGPTDLPPGTTEEPSIYYDTFEMLFGFTTSPPETTTTLPPEEPIYYDDFETIFGFTTPPPDVSEEHADYYDKQVRKRRDAASMDRGDGSGEASIDQSAENTEADHGPTDLSPGTTEEPSIYYDTFEMLFGFTTSPPETTTTLPPEEPIYYDDFETIFGFTTPPPDVSEEHADYYGKQVRKRRDAASMDGGDGSGEASIDQSAENTEADHGPTDLPPGTTEEPGIYYDTFEMLFGFTTSPPETTTTLPPEEPTDPMYYDYFETIFGFTTPPPDTSEEHADYYDEPVRKRRDAPSMDGGDGSGEASIDQSAENTEADHGPTDLPPGTTEEPGIYYDTFEMLFGFTTSPPETTTTLPPEEPTDPMYYDYFETIFGFTTPPPDTSEEHADYYDEPVRKRRDAPSMDGGDGSGEASIDQSAENTEADHGPTDLPPGTTEEPSIYYDTFEMLFGFTTSPPETTTTLPPEEPIYYDDFETIFGFTTPPPDISEEHADYSDKQGRKRRDTPSMDGGDGSGEASIDQSEENKEVDYAPTDLPLDTTVEPTDTIHYDTFEMLFGFTTSPPEMTEEPADPIYNDTFETIFGFTTLPPDTSEEHVDYYDKQVRKRRDAPSMDGGDGSGEASIDQSEKNKNLESKVEQRSKRNAKAQTTLYGIFQLSDIACESGSSPSQNLCGLSCSALTDDDINDDIACLRVLLNLKIEKIFTPECLTVDPSVYFTTCG